MASDGERTTERRGGGPAEGGLLGLSKGDTVDRYRLIEPLGEGGMGVVWRAEQTEPVRREVALKLVRGDMATQAAIRRFEAERQALAMMDHPAIATIYDAGTSSDGAPFFVMELVTGEPIDRFCARRRFTLEERLMLVREVARAVHHAHERGVLHRDLKPGNILVGFRDGDPYPRVIDFGVAKALSGSLAGDLSATRIGQVVGTPAYMSPEQLMGDASRLDPRSDIFSLGVVLYELVTGRLPHDPQEFEDFPARPVHRRVLDDPVPRPSERLMRSESLLSAAADERRLNEAQLLHALRNDLQDIILSALQKNPSLRYRSALDLADDISRYLDGRPLLPMPMRSRSALYRIGKAADRWDLLHRARVATACVCALVLAICTVSVALVLLDWWAALGLFGEYGEGGLDPWGVIGMNLGGGALCLTVLIAGRGFADARMRPVIITAVCLGSMCVWAASLLFDVFEYTAGGLLADERFRRVFALIYFVIYGSLAALSAACIPVAWLVQRFGRPRLDDRGARAL